MLGDLQAYSLGAKACKIRTGDRKAVREIFRGVKAMKPEIPSISQADIERWVGSASFQKGQTYYHRGMIFKAHVKGQTIQARCHGAQAVSYQVQATLGPQQIQSADCSCPVGAGGRCKHVAALLLTWLNDPDRFQESESLAALEKRSKAELIAIIRLMLEREPDLEVLLDLPLPGTESSRKPLDPDVIRKQVEHAFENPHDEWGWADPYDIVRDLKPLFDLATQNNEQENYENAAIIYQAIANTVLKFGDAVIQDENGRLSRILWVCITGLGGCLPALIDSKLRESSLRTLFDIYAWDTVEAGGISISDEAPGIMIEQATLEERQRIIEWIRSIMPTGDSWSDDYHRQNLGGFQIALQADQLEDEAFLTLCRQTGRVHDLVDRLLSLNRVDEAAREARQASDYQLLGLADIFVQYEQGQLAQSLLRSRVETSSDSRLPGWLKTYAEKQGDFAQALDLAIKLFWMRPSIEAYTEMRHLAEHLDQWRELRRETLDHLAKKGEYSFLTGIYLEEGQIDPALTSLEKARSESRWGISNSLQLQVAEAAHQDRPLESIRLYLHFIRHLIAIRGRGNYAQAAEHLKQVQEIYRRLGDLQGWQTLITNLRAENRSLRALQDELNRARL
jgi:uncharacterized Zn finger protein